MENLHYLHQIYINDPIHILLQILLNGGLLMNLVHQLTSYILHLLNNFLGHRVLFQFVYQVLNRKVKLVIEILFTLDFVPYFPCAKLTIRTLPSIITNTSFIFTYTVTITITVFTFCGYFRGS